MVRNRLRGSGASYQTPSQSDGTSASWRVVSSKDRKRSTALPNNRLELARCARPAYKEGVPLVGLSH